MSQTNEARPEAHPPDSWKPRGLRPLSVVICVLLLVGTLAATLLTRTTVRDQERRLLKERAAEVGLLFQSSSTSSQANFSQLGAVLKLTDATPAAFAEAAKPMLTPTTPGVALLRPQGDGFVVVNAAGPAFSIGQHVSGVRAAAARQALDGRNLISTPVIQEGGVRRIGTAAGPPFAPDGAVLFRETVLAPSATQSRASAAFSELVGALYDGTRADPSQIVVASGSPNKASYREVFNLGGSPYLLVLGSRRPLVGPFASKSPWLVLTFGLLLTVILALFSEGVLRRRDYAMALVEERTAALRDSLASLRTAQEALVRQERLVAVGQLASAVGHELRNPLTAISNALYLIRGLTESSADERITRHLGTAEREVAAASLIISDLLDYARARPPAVGAVDLNGVIAESLEVAPPPGSVRVVWEPRPGVPAVAADRDQLRQVILNLLTNGYDAMPDGGELVVAVSANDGVVETTVRDSGIGMDGETRAHMFEPFFTTKAQGVGLGLAVTEQIVAAHHGRISVQSDEGRGATFVVSLPVFKDRAGMPA